VSPSPPSASPVTSCSDEEDYAGVTVVDDMASPDDSTLTRMLAETSTGRRAKGGAGAGADGTEARPGGGGAGDAGGAAGGGGGEEGLDPELAPLTPAEEAALAAARASTGLIATYPQQDGSVKKKKGKKGKQEPTPRSARSARGPPPVVTPAAMARCQVRVLAGRGPSTSLLPSSSDDGSSGGSGKRRKKGKGGGGKSSSSSSSSELSIGGGGADGGDGDDDDVLGVVGDDLDWGDAPVPAKPSRVMSAKALRPGTASEPPALPPAWHGCFSGDRFVCCPLGYSEDLGLVYGVSVKIRRSLAIARGHSCCYYCNCSCPCCSSLPV
jgi:hypothetical protein